MEFPHLGQHCHEPSCKQLDFLPMKCDACNNIFCGDHIIYTSHSCKESYKKDNQIPVCPLCNLPCPVRKGESPDIVVGRHIESDCQSDPAKSRRKVYSNKCSQKGCKKKELVPVKCEKCRLNFCLRHRHEQDHSCTGFQGSGRSVSNTGAAAMFRSQPKSSQPKSTGKPQTSQGAGNSNNSNGSRARGSQHTSAVQVQGSMTEDEALARALAMSLGGNTGGDPTAGMTAQEREDFLLAQALSASEQESSRQQSHQSRPPRQAQTQRSGDKCLVQ